MKRVYWRTVLAIVTLLVEPAAAPQPNSANKPSPKSYDQSRVGDDDPQRVVVPTNQVLSPLGRQVAYGGRPVDLALSPNGRWLAVLDRASVLVVDPQSAKIVSRAPHKGGSYAGLCFTPDGKRVLASSIGGTIGVFDVSADGQLAAAPPIKLAAEGSDPERVLPVALAVTGDGKSLWAALNLKNSLAEIDLAAGRVKREIAVGNAPFGVLLLGDKAYVTNWGGRLPDAASVTGPAGDGAPVRVDPVRYIANDGSVSVVDLAALKETKQIVVGLHPSAIVASPDGAHLVVANANSDTLSVIDARKDQVIETISTRPDEQRVLFGSSPVALAFAADGRSLYAANGTNNAVAVIEFAPPKSRLLGAFPTGWYPAALVFDKPRASIYVANVKGIGSRSLEWKGERKVKGKEVFGYTTHDQLGTISLVELSSLADLRAHSSKVLANNRMTETVSALAPPRNAVAPRALPERHGESSKIKHVLYIIKENRTYDQVFGDIERGEGDESLCIFGREVTPNCHKLVDEFVLLDNFYCSGVLSADGHQWATEAYVTDYLERGFGGWPRSYPYAGGDALAYASSGFLWDNALANKKTLRVYGEFVRATIRWKDPLRDGRPKFIDCYQDFLNQTGLIDIQGAATVKSLEPHVCPTAIGFPNIVPDIHRADQFKRELAKFEAEGKLPNLMIMLLPNDHTSGTRPGMPTPEASVADNDLALGQVVEAISHSKFWPETAVFVVQDDPQAGFDHIDGHRTLAMVISPYTPRRVVDSTNYNQTSMIRTMELILGLPPMNQLDASASAMTGCFTEEANFAPFVAVKNNIPLDRLNPELTSIRDERQRHWATVSLELPLDDVDEADEDTLNRILWHATRGRDDTYPAWAVLSENEEEEEAEERRERALKEAAAN